MISDLEVVSLYEKNNNKSTEFVETVDSSLRVKTDYEKTVLDKDWIDVLEGTIPYLDNIFRNPNRFIENEEEIVKIEMAKRITVDSIKHLSKNTNLIQDIDEETQDVKPSKILNINKEENYNTYENRLIYTLVQNMKFFIIKKKEALLTVEKGKFKNDKQIEYSGNCKVFNENINISIKMNSSIEDDISKDNDIQDILKRIKKLEQSIIDLSSSETYRIIEKSRITLIRPPIKKTNLILKNTNFQYAMRLWNYLQDHLEDETQEINEKKDYSDQGSLKKLVDENFLLNYLVVNTLDKDYEEEVSKEKEEDKKKMREQLTEQLMEQIVSLNPDLTKEQIQQMIGEKYAAIQYRNMATIAGIQKIFRKHIDKYLEKLNST